MPAGELRGGGARYVCGMRVMLDGDSGGEGGRWDRGRVRVMFIYAGLDSSWLLWYAMGGWMEGGRGDTRDDVVVVMRFSTHTRTGILGGCKQRW
jgi:hypothetical protein